MIKYKLIKNYPQFKMPLECHSIADGGYYTNKGDMVYNPEDYPEFWELVVKKDYEILTVNPSENHTGYSDKKAIVSWNTCNKDFKYWEIHSVKRLSDGEIFTIGDNTNAGIIKQFNICGNTLQLKVDGLTFLNDYLVKKVKQPLFTTEDGKGIFEGDEVNSVNKTTFILNCGNLNGGVVTSNFISNNNYLYFSTKSLAETFILMNKPCLSINDVNILKSIVFANWDKTLKELVKSKL